LYQKGGPKMLLKLTTGVTFINNLWTAFTHTDPKSAKRYWNLDRIFTLLGSARVKAFCKYFVKIDPWPTSWPLQNESFWDTFVYFWIDQHFLGQMGHWPQNQHNMPMYPCNTETTKCQSLHVWEVKMLRNDDWHQTKKRLRW